MTAAPKFASRRESDGLMPYLVTTYTWGRHYYRLEWASSLKAAKAEHGWTRQPYTTISVRRATADDLETLGGAA